MPLTYQPFADIADVHQLHRDLQMNVPDTERAIGGAIGAALALAGIARDGVSRWVMLLAGSALLHRSITGRCLVYKQFEMDRRHRRAGVPGNHGTRIEASVIINCPADKLYGFWRKLEQLPRVMRNVKRVEQLDRRRSHWKVAGPAGQTLEWDAEIINDHEGRLIAWQSLPDATVSNAGSVRFEPTASGATRVKVALEFDPPAGAIGAAVAELLGSSPEADLEEDLRRFKEFAERELKGVASE